MSTSHTLATALLLTSALSAPAFAQTDPAPASTPSAGQVEEPVEEETVEISGPGASADDGQEIVVIGRNIPNAIRATPEVVTVLSAADIQRTGEGDIAGALGRVTGLSVVGNGFVYVRGLGDRYSLALLNGLALPSPEPLRRVVPLDIFPSSLVSSAVVQKSYSVAYPAEFGGGVINLTTTAIPRESFLKIGGSVSGDTFTSSNLGYTYYGSDLDWLGYDDGSRSPAPVFQRALESGSAILPGADFSEDEIKAITRSLLNAETTVVQQNNHIPLNTSLDVSAGLTTDIGGTRLGIIASGGYDNSFKTRESIQQTGPGNILARDARYVRTEHRVITNALLGLGLEFGEHKIRFTNVYVRDTSKQARIGQFFSQSGFGVPDDFSQPADFLQQNTNWTERQLFNSQAVGEFEFGDFSVDARFGYANSQREAPYERSFTYVWGPSLGIPGVTDYVNYLSGSNRGSASVSFSDLNEDVYNGALDLAYRFPSGFTVSAGYAYLDTQRSSTRRDFQFLPQGTLNDAVAQLRPDYLLSDYNVDTYDILLQETSGVAGASAYDAALKVHAAYLQGEADFGQVRLQGGVRYEKGEQQVALIDITNLGGVPAPTRLEKDYFLPALTATWNFAADMQLRVHASKTIARPQFRELANQLYLDTESDRQFIGNRFLVDSELINAEARFEWYFAREQRVSIAGFFKKIDNPIEAVTNIGGGFVLQTSFANAPSAVLYGAEIEAVKYWPLDTLGGGFFSTRRAVTIANYTYSKSQLEVESGDNVLLDTGGSAPFVQPADSRFRDGDPLTGQSDHLVNVQVGLEDTERLSQQTLLLTYASDRVTGRGAFSGSFPYPDTVEKPGLRLDFVWREGIEIGSKEVELKFQARNITGRRFIEVQEGEILIQNNVYDVGTSFSLGASIKF
ncbi:outer membrane beta-barrel protein [Sphingomonas suaedae]|uniref:Outer membrane beta-barrel protein n=1 Tax=Sphingomonas suaedae TaxID=2599297 RepID=A0A518RD93_9SPHN|nr:TonB-dependent receptor [Sphingomonas suaedae]QDX25364.1 outer membrane beta-barrel protein [Sphingomonas suaedae]